MYRFKYFTALLLAASIMSCKEEEIPAEAPFFKMDGGVNLDFRATGGEQFVNVYTNKAFTATSSAPDWCKTAIVGKGRNNLQIVADQNDVAEERSAVITVSAEGYSSLTIPVKQAAGTPPRPVVEGVDERISNANPDVYYAFHDESDLAAPFIGSAPLDFSVPASVVAATPPDGRRAVTVTKANHVKVTTPVESGLKTYTLLYDVRVPVLNLWYSLLQTSEGNSDDGDLFVNKEGKVGVSQYTANPVIAANTWARIVVVVNVANGESVCKYYINGEFIFANGSSSIPNRMVLNNYFYIFTDEDGEENDLDCSSFAVWAKTILSDAEIAALGAP